MMDSIIAEKYMRGYACNVICKAYQIHPSVLYRIVDAHKLRRRSKHKPRRDRGEKYIPEPVSLASHVR